jgi:hypothetical protein
MPATSAGVAGMAPGPAAGQRVFLVSRRISVVHALGGWKARIHPEQRPSARCANLLLLPGNRHHLRDARENRRWRIAICCGHARRRPQPYETVRSEFDLRTAFQTYFDQADVPMISAISLGVDTFASGEGGTAAAYIHRIELLE